MTARPPARTGTAGRTASPGPTVAPGATVRFAWMWGRLLRPLLLIFALPAVLVAIWWYAGPELTGLLVPDNRLFLFTPLDEVLVAFRETWLGPRLVDDLWPSVRRLALGYSGALLLGIGLGVVVGSSATVRALMEPVLEFLRAIPPPVLIPIIALFTGIGDTRKVLVIIAGCIWPILLNTVEGVRATDEVLSDTCRSYGIRGHQRLRHLVLRSASPQIMTGARQALAIGIILMVISELTGATEGVGYAVEVFQTSFRYPQMWSGVILLGLLGVVLSLLFRLVEHRVLGWYHGIRATQKER